MIELIAVRGDSIEPKLSDGDLILVDRAQRQIADGIAYVLRIDTDLLVQNVQRVRPGVIALLSANAHYPPREINAEGLDGEVEIIGRVVASMHEWWGIASRFGRSRPSWGDIQTLFVSRLRSLPKSPPVRIARIYGTSHDEPDHPFKSIEGSPFQFIPILPPAPPGTPGVFSEK